MVVGKKKKKTVVFTCALLRSLPDELKVFRKNVQNDYLATVPLMNWSLYHFVVLLRNGYW